jgi:hypothetical protein
VPASRFRRGAVPWGEAGVCPAPCASRSGHTPPHRVGLCAGFAALCQGGCAAGITTAASGSCRPGGALRSTNTPSSSRHARRARAVTAKDGTKVHAATIILHDRHRRRARAPPREGVRSARIAGSRHSGTAGRATRQGRPASRFHVRCPPVGVHPLSFLNDLIRPSTPSNPRSFGPSCRVPRLPAPPLRSGFPCASSRFRWRGRPGRLFWSRGRTPRRAKKEPRNAEPRHPRRQRRRHA